MEVRFLTNVNGEEIYSICGNGKDYRVSVRQEDDSYIVAIWMENLGEWKDFICCKGWKEEILSKVKLILTPTI